MVRLVKKSMKKQKKEINLILDTKKNKLFFNKKSVRLRPQSAMNLVLKLFEKEDKFDVDFVIRTCYQIPFSFSSFERLRSCVRRLNRIVYELTYEKQAFILTKGFLMRKRNVKWEIS